MDNIIINSILDIDADATNRLQEATDKRNKIISDARAEEENIINGCIKEAENRLKSLENAEKDKADKRILEVEKKRDGEIAELDDIYNSKHLIWEDEIYKVVLC